MSDQLFHANFRLKKLICNFLTCKTKLTLAQSVSSSLCACKSIFCSIHKEIHENECLEYALLNMNAKKKFEEKMNESKTISSHLTRI